MLPPSGSPEKLVSNRSLYDDDILLWSEQQADVIRGLAHSRRPLPNELDIENVAEEIESVGRSELAAVESQLQNILLHLIKLWAESDSRATRHWRAEILAFHSEAKRRYAPSMQQRINFDHLWELACEQASLELDQPTTGGLLPSANPFSLDDLLAEKLNAVDLVGRLPERGIQPT
jgi:hypothetical protein